MTDKIETRSGLVAFVGRPNAGKSTLLNKLVGEKIAAVSDKPQTTRTQIKGVLNLDQGQIVFVDTPGVHKPGYKLNKRMMQAVLEALKDVDIVVLMRDASTKMGQGERYVLDLIKEAARPTFLLLNKIDLIKEKGNLLPIIDFYRQEYEFKEVIPLSAIRGDNTKILVDKLLEYLPIGPRLFEEDTLTDRSLRSIAAEMVREKVLHYTSEEIPFVTAVICESWQEEESQTQIHCVIYVERDSQRAIIIGRAGQKLKQIGIAARKDIQKLLDKKVDLRLFVKVKEHWRNDEEVLDQLGTEGLSYESS
ncbi:MAG: GTPase Era [Acidobacteria bacterium]|nr:GTPase Era [Acidobacteriota bacterium]